MNDLKLKKSLATALGLTFVVENEEIWFYDLNKQFDPLNNWNDLMGLVVEYRIMLEPHDLPCADWCAFWEDGFGKCLYATNESPQRALIECLVKVLTEGKVK